MTRLISRIAALAIWAACVSNAQLNTGRIVGAVTDPQGLAVSGAEVALASSRTGDIRTTTSNVAGDFVLPAIPTGSHTLRIASPGFQKFERRDGVLTSNEYLSLGTIKLEVGATTETVTVTSQAAVVQSASAENSSLLDAKQVGSMLTRGRDDTSLLRLLPGVSQTNDENTLGDRIGAGTPSISGLRNNDNTITLDGMTSSDADNVNVGISAVSIDSIEEVKVLVNNFQAEYGRNAGARINVTGVAQLPHGDRTYARWFNPSVFTRPARGDAGNAPKDIFRGPGINNWDLSVFKNFPIKSEKRILQFRSEFYNAFNHTQFSSVDTAARFDAAGQQVNARLGQITGARSARVIQFALTFRF